MQPTGYLSVRQTYKDYLEWKQLRGRIRVWSLDWEFYTLVLEPSGSNLGIPLELLKRSPFSTYLVPGIVLLVVNGLGSLMGAAASFTRHRYAGETAMALGVFLVAWIILQVYWFSGFHWLHALYLGLGLLEFVLGWYGFRAGLKRSKI